MRPTDDPASYAETDPMLSVSAELLERCSAVDVATAPGLRPPPLHHARQDVLTSVLSDFADRYFLGAFAALEDLNDVTVAIERVVDHLISMAIREWRLTALMLRELPLLPHDMQAEIADRSASLVQRLLDALEIGVRQKRIHPKVRPSEAALSLLNLSYSVYTWAPLMDQAAAESLESVLRDSVLRTLGHPAVVVTQA